MLVLSRPPALSLVVLVKRRWLFWLFPVTHSGVGFICTTQVRSLALIAESPLKPDITPILGSVVQECCVFLKKVLTSFAGNSAMALKR